MLICPANLADAKQIALVQESSWLAAYPEATVTSILAQVPLSKRIALWQIRLADGNNHIYLVNVEDNIVGFCFFRPNNALGKTELEALYVLPKYWRKGLGKTLIKYGQSQLPEPNQWQLWVLADNINAQAFYLQQGFNFDGRTSRQTIGTGSYLKLGMTAYTQRHKA